MMRVVLRMKMIRIGILHGMLSSASDQRKVSKARGYKSAGIPEIAARNGEKKTPTPYRRSAISRLQRFRVWEP